jgi:hypothetical protein
MNATLANPTYNTCLGTVILLIVRIQCVTHKDALLAKTSQLLHKNWAPDTASVPVLSPIGSPPAL